jgi:hypothetical protein
VEQQKAVDVLQEGTIKMSDQLDEIKQKIKGLKEFGGISQNEAAKFGQSFVQEFPKQEPG